MYFERISAGRAPCGLATACTLLVATGAATVLEIPAPEERGR